MLCDLLALEVEDFDTAGGGSAEPVAIGREDEGVDNVTGFEGVEVLALVQVPEHSDTVLTARGGKRTIGRDGDGVNVSGVSVVVGLELELGQFPDLNELLADCSNMFSQVGSEILVEKIVSLDGVL